MRKKRSLAPRTRESVEKRQLSADTSSNGTYVPAGEKSLNKNIKDVRLVQPRCYKKGGKTVIRVWNMLDPEDPSERLLEGRLNGHELAGLGGMSISEPSLCVRYAGVTVDSGFAHDRRDTSQCSYIIAKDKNETIEGIEFWELPYVKLYTMAKRAKEASANGNVAESWDMEWNKLLNGQMPSLGAFKQKYFVVCSVYENSGELDLTREHVEYKSKGKTVIEDRPRNGVALGDAPGDPLVVMELSVSAGRNLLKMCCREQAPWDAESYDLRNPIPKDTLKAGSEKIEAWMADHEAKKLVAEESAEKRYKRDMGFMYGDPCGRFNAAKGTVDGGVFFTIYNPELVTIDNHTSYSGDSAQNFVEYEVAVSSKYAGPEGSVSASLSPEQVNNIFDKHVYLWKESDADPDDSYLLHTPSIEERCVLLAKAFKQVPGLLEFAWMSNPEYLAFDEVRAIIDNRTVSAVAVPQDDEDDEDEVAIVAPWDKADFAVQPVAAAKTASDLVDEFDEFDEDELEDDELEDDELEDDELAEDDNPPLGDVFDEEDDEEDEEDSSTSDDFDEFDDEVDPSVQAQLDESLAKAKGLSRSKARVKKAPAKKAPRRTKKKG
jgi:hypothetical protein